MKTNAITVGLIGLVCALSVGCARGDGAAPSQGGSAAAQGAAATTRASTHSFAYAASGASAASRVERVVRGDGAETLLGTTELTVAGATHPMVLVETADLDASGHLTGATAQLSTGPHGRDLLRAIRLDAARGTVTVNDAVGERSWLVATDHPWIYEGLFDDVAPLASNATAVQAWVAKRAAQSGARLRAIQVAARRSHLTLAEQVVFADGAGSLVVLGDEAIEADSDFVRALPWKALSAAASLTASPSHAADGAGYCVPGPA